MFNFHLKSSDQWITIMVGKIWVRIYTTSIHLLQLKIQSHLQKRRLWMPVWKKKNTESPRFSVLAPMELCVKGCGMGPQLVLVYPCFRKNVVVTCKIGSFLWSLDNLLQKNVIVFFFGNQISKWRSFWKKGYFLTYSSHFLVTREKLQKFL